MVMNTDRKHEGLGHYKKGSVDKSLDATRVVMMSSVGGDGSTACGEGCEANKRAFAAVASPAPVST